MTTASSILAQRSMEKELRNASKESLVETASFIVAEKTEGWTMFDASEEDTIPVFTKNELRLGRVLGRGGFCVATDIDRIRIDGVNMKGSSIGSNAFLSIFKKDDTSDSGRGSSLGPLTRTGIATLSQKRNRKGGRFVLKRVSEEHEKSKTAYLKGVIDLTMEAKILAALDHPNIISLCGVSKIGAGDFIMVEKLQETLSARLKAWTKTERQCKGITGMVTGSKRKEMELYESRISTAFDIASALDYLHSRDIIFRDLKPDNIGFNQDGCLKVFDFGLAKELTKKDRTKKGLYKLTGLTGAIRYMAPEVSLGEPYNLSADVYSWSMVMWFILALEPPFGFYTEEMIQDRVHQRGSRPALYSKWSVPMGNLLKQAWSKKISARPSITEVCGVLKSELYAAEDETNNMSTASGADCVTL